ncbi:MAG: hypothetical protein HY863_00145 [Chloroflexi bacterium]|nr:hypothetical protein [Chloroflexota bacterium]
MFNGNLWFRFVSMVLFLILPLSACQPEALATMAVPSPTVIFTIQPTPTQLAADATPIPTANFVPKDLLGIWTRSDPDRGTLFLIFNENGTYAASHGSPDTIIHSGDYSLEGRVFTFMNGWDCADTPGIYIARIIAGGKYLLLEPLDDNCADRPIALKGLRWDRVEAAPTP